MVSSAGALTAIVRCPQRTTRLRKIPRFAGDCARYSGEPANHSDVKILRLAAI
jgi:hypothetical protein